MNMLNMLLIEGNMVDDPFIQDKQNAKPLVAFCIAHKRYHRNKKGEVEEDLSFFDCEAWGELARSVMNAGRKGKTVRISGRIKQQKWIARDENTGKTRHRQKVIIIVHEIEFKSNNPDTFKNNASASYSDDYNEDINI
jgi:single-strand DNA-binding protein